MSDGIDAGAPSDGAMPGAAVDRLLADFRAWLLAEPRAAAAAMAEGAPPAPIDLATVVGQFTALRHEINLQTRGVRAQQEQTGQAVDAVRQALAAAEQAGADRAEQQAERQADALRPLLKALVDARDALALAERQVAKARAALAQLEPGEPHLSVPPLTPPAPPVVRGGSWWSRLFGADAPADTRDLVAWARQLQTDTAAAVGAACRDAYAAQTLAAHAQLRQTVDAILIGYEMSLERLDRALDEAGLEPIDCLGGPFDPELMEVVEVMYEADRAAAEVVEIVRPGYLWNDKLFRTAQVRVARS